MQQSLRSVRTQRVQWLFVGLPPHPALWRRSAIERQELLARLSPLAEGSFLDILSLLSQHDELSAQELMGALHMTQPTASRHLQQLVSSGHIMERRQGGAAKVYRLTPGYIAQTMRALEQHLINSGPAAALSPKASGPKDAVPGRAAICRCGGTGDAVAIAPQGSTGRTRLPGRAFSSGPELYREGSQHAAGAVAHVERPGVSAAGVIRSALAGPHAQWRQYWRVAPEETEQNSAPVT